MTKVIRYLSVALVTLLVVAGCVRNDIPYPIIKLDILSFEADGLKSPAQIDPATHAVSLELLETTDIRKLNVTNVEITEGATSSVAFPGVFDMRTPLYVVLSEYQDYEWVITANQNITYEFRVEGQIGESEIDVNNHIATAYVPIDADMENISILAAKFGPESITSYSPDPLSLTSFYDTVRHVEVRYHGDIVEDWTLRIVPIELEVEFVATDAWAKRIWLRAIGREGSDLGFRYRAAGSEEWLTVENVTVEGSNFSACIDGLEPLSTYEVIAYSNENTTPVVTLTTEETFMLINGGMEDWSFTDGTYYPFALDTMPYWGTGNDGAKIASTILTEPTEDVRPGSSGKYAALLQSKKAAVMGIGKFAAGNIFLGRFGGLKGFNGLVFFGRPSTARPVALRGWVKYEQGTIDEVGVVPSSRPDLKVGDKDEGQIFIAVGDWTAEEYGGDADSPVSIDTSNESTFFNIKGKNVIGSGELIFTSSTDGWIEFNVPLEYVSTSRIPTHMILVCTSSRYGDYFTGSIQSRMVVDDLELVF